MLTRNEHAIADAYERGRLVDALAGGPRGAHAAHRGAVWAGVLLTLLVVAGYAIRALFEPGPPTTWSACTADGAGIALAIPSAAQVVTATDRGAVVTADGSQVWLVAADAGKHAARYPVPSGAQADELLTAAGLPPAAQAVRVPAGWLALFDDAGTLASDTWVRAHWSAATLQPLAALVCAELITDAPRPYVRLATLPPEASWTAPPAGLVTRDVAAGGSAPEISAGLPAAWLALRGPD